MMVPLWARCRAPEEAGRLSEGPFLPAALSHFIFETKDPINETMF